MKIKLLSIILLSPALALAQAQPMSLDAAIAKGIAQSKVLQASSARVQEANARVTEAKDGRLPNVSLSGSYLQLPNADVTLERPPNAPPANTPHPKSAAYAIANLSVPLYNGGRIRNGIGQAQLLEQAAQLDRNRDEQTVAYNVAQAYIGLYKAQQSEAILTQNLSAAKSRDTTLGRLEQNGIIARNDLLKAELQTSQLRLRLLEASSGKATALAQLNILLGQNQDVEIAIEEDIAPQLQPMKSYDEYLDMAMRQRADVQSTALKHSAANKGIKVAQAAAYPRIALTGGYIAADVPGILTVSNAINIGVSLQYNVSNIWKKNTQLQGARAQEVEVAAREQLLNDEVKVSLVKDYNALKLALQKKDVYEEALTQAQENYRITKNKYDNQLSTINDLLDADAFQTQASLNVSVAKADILLASKQLMLTTGVSK